MMMIAIKEKTLIVIGILILPFITVKSQFDKTFNQYWLMYSFYNPAATGKDNRLNVLTAFNIHSMKLSRAPKSFTVNADMPVTFWNKEHGIGAGMVLESIGLYRNRRAWGQYSFKLKAGKGIWSFGIQGGTLSISIKPKNKNLGKREGIDNYTITTAHKSHKFDIAAGIAYSRPQFFIGISGYHLTSPKITLREIDSLRIQPILYFTGGYNIQTRNPLFSIQPSFHMQTDFKSLKLNLTGCFSYTYNEKSLNGGITWSPDNSVSVFIGAGFRGFMMGYAYERFTPTVDKIKGRHELIVKYSTVINRQKKNKYKHQSIRIL